MQFQENIQFMHTQTSTHQYHISSLYYFIPDTMRMNEIIPGRDILEHNFNDIIDIGSDD